MPVAWRLADRLPARNALIGLEIGAALATLCVGLAVAAGYFYLACGLLFIRGFFDMTTKVARNVALKAHLDDSYIDRANNLVMTCNYVGQAIGTVVGFWLISFVPITAIAAANACTYVLSALTCLLLPFIPAVRSDIGGYISLFHRGRVALLSSRTIMHAMIILVFSVVFLQAFNQVTRVWIPLAWLGLPPQYGAISEAVGVFGIVARVVFVNYLFTGSRNMKAPLTTILVFASFSMIAPFVAQNPLITFSPCFAFMLHSKSLSAFP